MTLLKIISGGQSGVDRGALDAALAGEFPCGGWCPAGRLAEDGPIPEWYPLSELENGGYLDRTIKNLEDSDGTAIIYFGALEGGTEQTVLHCMRRQKPCKLIDAEEIPPARAAALVATFVATNAIATLNVAGPRLSKIPKAHAYAYEVVTRLLKSSVAMTRDPRIGARVAKMHHRRG